MNIVNNKPLATDTLIDDQSSAPLTLSNLLTAKTTIVLPPPATDFQESELYIRKRWRRFQYLLIVYWGQWRAENLQSLQSRNWWNYPTRNIKVGDIVIIKDENTISNHWSLAIVEEAFTSKDGRVRKVKLRVAYKSLDNQGRRYKATSYLEHPSHKLVLLLETQDWWTAKREASSTCVEYPSSNVKHFLSSMCHISVYIRHSDSATRTGFVYFTPVMGVFLVVFDLPIQSVFRFLDDDL